MTTPTLTACPVCGALGWIDPCSECRNDDGLLHCDLCDVVEYADDLTPDWNGETGNHLSCEAAQ